MMTKGSTADETAVTNFITLHDQDVYSTSLRDCHFVWDMYVLYLCVLSPGS